MGIAPNVFLFLVVGALVAGITLNLLVGASCEFFQSSSSHEYSVRLGAFSFSVDDPDSYYYTAGECEDYSAWRDEDDTSNAIRTAQVSALLAPCCGIVLVLIIVAQQMLFPVPFSGSLISLLYTGAQIGTALVWLLRQNDLCKNVVGGCEWGEAATWNMIAQICYLAAAILHQYIPDPRSRRVEEHGEQQETKSRQENGHNDSEEEETGTPQTTPVVVANTTSGSMEDVQQIKNELTSEQQRADQLQTQLHQQRQELQDAKQSISHQGVAVQQLLDQIEEQKSELVAAANAQSTAAVNEATEIRVLTRQLEEAKEEIEQQKIMVQYLEGEDDRQKKELVSIRSNRTVDNVEDTDASTKASAADEINKAEEMERLRNELSKQEQELQRATAAAEQFANEVVELRSENESQKEALAAAVAQGESIKVLRLQRQLEEQKMELEQARADADEYAESLDRLQFEQESQKLTATETSAEAEEIEQLKKDLERQKSDFEQAQAMAAQYTEIIQQMEREMAEQKKELDASVTLAASSVSPEKQNGEIERLEKELEQQKKEFETFKLEKDEYIKGIKDLQKLAIQDAKKTAAEQVEQLSKELEHEKEITLRLREEVELLRSGGEEVYEEEEVEWTEASLEEHPVAEKEEQGENLGLSVSNLRQMFDAK